MATVKGSGINIPIRWIERGCPQSWMRKSSRWQLREGIDVFSRKNFLLFSFQIFFSTKWCSLKQFSFIYFLISWTTRSICGISQIKNPMIPITKIPVMTVARVSFVINYFQTYFEQSFRYRLPLNYFSFEPMDQPCTSETWSRTQSSWPYKISAEQKWQHERFTVFLMTMNYVDSQQYQVFMFTADLLPRNFSWLNLQGIKTVLY